MHGPCNVLRHNAFTVCEAVQPAHGNQRPCGRRRREPALAQHGEELTHLDLRHRAQIRDTQGLQVFGVAAQVTGVGVERVAGGAAFHGEVVEIGRHQLSNHASPSNRIFPSRALTPLAKAGSDATAASKPLSANAMTYGSVTFVSAYVDVFGTAPGMFATQ